MAGLCVQGGGSEYIICRICTCLIGRKLNVNIRENGMYSNAEEFFKIAYVSLAHQCSRQKWLRNLALNCVAESHQK